MPTVELPAILHKKTGIHTYFTESEDVHSCLEALCEAFPAIENHLFDRAGELKPYARIFVNKTDIAELNGLHSLLAPEDRVRIVIATAGG